ncbi:carboxyl-terminal processing protease [Chryseolinea serpens]|uniref:Carboxyl-terminal processing protease n=1 Tax=Chryseolinea serpens TaxID=947013 RepID=A0A1M5P9P7_9BACT|nr:S41 family peptidase [Chryseolinea serpens]SHG98498.1 carboxyl-terminal processing protease [Chryseolinea serpens]
MTENSNSKYQIRLPLVLCLGLAAGVFVGARLNTPKGSSDVGSDVQKFREVLTQIQNDYVDTVNTSELVDDAIQHMLNKLDPHSAYINATDRIAANEDLRGNFDGIGVEFNIFHDTIVVVSALSGGPSEALGIQSGDKIIKVDDKLLAGIGVQSPDVMKALKGPKGTEVKVTILRGSKEIDYKIVRDKIPQYSVDVSYMVDAQTGYIKVNRFAATTFEEFHEALKKLKESGMKRLVLDLQGNPGGYMNMAIDMADEFLSEGKKIVFTNGKEKKYNSEAMSTARGDFETGPLIVLVNEGSASASEILSGALQDNDRALIVGRRSFGKGLVQSPFDLSDGSELRLTISRYYTPTGRSIQKPYEDEDEYSRDIISRYNHGEFFHADSIRFNDSLKYVTPNGRSVYGGGGIMPDYFVPLDTTLNSHYLNELYTSTSIQEYTFGYAETHKDELQKKGFQSFLKTFVVSDDMLDGLVKVGERNKVKPDRKELRLKKKLFQVHIKAQIARKLWNNEGFFQVMNETNEILLQAMKLFDRIPNELDRRKM